MVTSQLAIRVRGLRKRFGAVDVLDGLDLEVPAGEVCALLGSNGAGKTTAVRVMSTLLRPDGGTVEVAGFDVARDAVRVRGRIGLIGQYAAVDELLSGRQNLVMFGRLYHLPVAAARRRAEELLERFGLVEAGARRAGTYSGGMRRRLDLAAGLILAPPVLFLDEPTTGLDPRGRNEVWEAVRALTSSGTTVLLTTQYLDEADQLADRICLLAASGGRGGRVVAQGSPDRLKSMIGGDRVDVTVHDGQALRAAADVLAGSSGEPVTVCEDTRMVSVSVPARVGALVETVRSLDAAGVAVQDVALRRPTLDEVFLRLTGEPRAVLDGEEAA